MNQSNAEEDLDSALLASARASISALLNSTTNANETLGEAILENTEEWEDDDLFAVSPIQLLVNHTSALLMSILIFVHFK